VVCCQDLPTAGNTDLVNELIRKKMQGQGPSNSFKQLTKLIEGLAKLYNELKIILNDLDECKPELRGPLLEFISSIQSIGNARIIVFSRPEVDIKNEMGSFPTLSLEEEQINLKEDMELHIEKEFEDKKKWGTRFQTLREEIIELLIRGSGRNM
jgi:hypothetical protein